MKILLTGSSGYIGKYLFESLILIPKYELYILRQKCKDSNNINCITIDNIQNYNFDFVINCLGETKNASKMYKVNKELCLELFNKLNFKSIKKFIHFSTIAIYDKNIIGQIKNASNIKLDSDYANSKYEFDSFLMQQIQHIDKIFIFRPSNVMDGYLPGKFLFILSKFRVRFFSINRRYINWCPIQLVIEKINDVLDDKQNDNILIINKYEDLNSFYHIYLPKIHFIYLPVEILYCIIILFRMKRYKIKYNQLFSKHFFKSN